MHAFSRRRAHTRRIGLGAARGGRSFSCIAQRDACPILHAADSCTRDAGRRCGGVRHKALRRAPQVVWKTTDRKPGQLGSRLTGWQIRYFGAIRTTRPRSAARTAKSRESARRLPKESGENDAMRTTRGNRTMSYIRPFAIASAVPRGGTRRPDPADHDPRPRQPTGDDQRPARDVTSRRTATSMNRVFRVAGGLPRRKAVHRG
jgi:hypothetical protein